MSSAPQMCKCGKMCTPGSQWCANCCWDQDEDEEAPWTTHKKPVKVLSCFTKCVSCGKSYRGNSCKACSAVPKQPPKEHADIMPTRSRCVRCKKPSKLKYCTECTAEYNQRAQCQTCGEKVRNGRFCALCKDQYQATLPNICQTCNVVRVAADRPYCGNCIREYKTPRECRSCNKMTIVGIYCADCHLAYKARLHLQIAESKD